MDIWIYALNNEFKDVVAEIREPLNRLGIESHEVSNYKSSDLNTSSKVPALFFFDTVDELLLEQIKRISHYGQERLLAITSGMDSLSKKDFWAILQSGAADIISLPKKKKSLLKQISSYLNRWSVIDDILLSDLVRNNLIGHSVAWQRILKEIIEVTYFTDASILLVGETGCGKEMLARFIQTIYPGQKTENLITLDCTTIVPELSGSEFFGHEKGAFTGATASRNGAFALANNGTLFLDEIGELPLSMQTQLLRVIQEQQYKRVGGNQWMNSKFRLISATNKNLEEAIHTAQFRSDLYYRIAGWVCKLPPLRERREDILDLAKTFLTELRPDGECPELDTFVAQFISSRDYPGNIRELKQLINRINARYAGAGPISLGALPTEEQQRITGQQLSWNDAHFEQVIRQALCSGANLKEISQQASDTAIDIAVASENGNLQRAAKKLGVTDRTLQMRKANRKR